MPVIYEDTLNQMGKHRLKNEWWEAHGVRVVRCRLDGRHGVPVDFGDYFCEGSNVVVDTKANVTEVSKNINGRQHQRFREECKRAQNAGYRLVVLVENTHGFSRLAHVAAWTHSHCRRCIHYKRHACDPRRAGRCSRHGTPKPIQGDRLAKAMQTMQERYGVRFEFCAPKESARIVCELLGVDYE